MKLNNNIINIKLNFNFIIIKIKYLDIFINNITIFYKFD